MKSRICKRKSFNTYHRHLTGSNRSMNLVDGSAFHKGVARGLAGKDWEVAQHEASVQFDIDRQSIQVLPEMEWQLDDHKAMIRVMIDCYQKAFQDQGITVIQPECEFDIELPESRHNCIMLHWLDTVDGVDHWGVPPPEKILARQVTSPHKQWTYARTVIDSTDPGCRCWQPHRFVGKTDAVVSWMNNIWLLEHKTTSILGEQFWNQWKLDLQPTGYIYGIQKALKIPVSGFILNAIYKPSESQVSAWNKKRKNGPAGRVEDYIKYEREAFLREPRDLARFEGDLIDECNEWERDIVRGRFPMRPLAGVCSQYNRLCEFHSACVCHDESNELEALAVREKDYVDVKLEEICNKSS